MGHCHARSQASSQRLVLSACADSFCALTGLIEHYAQAGDTPVTQAWIVLLLAVRQSFTLRCERSLFDQFAL
jgi:hypothetical protein